MNNDPNVVRALIHDENEMINQRMHWFLILQGFMFAGIAFAWEKNSAICVVFSSVGMMSAISVGVLLRYGILAIRKLEQLIAEDNQPVLGRRSEQTPVLISFFLPWHFFPVVMGVAWLALIYIRIFDVA